MAPLAAQVAKAHSWPSSDYRDVIHRPKETQITGDAIIPFYLLSQGLLPPNLMRKAVTEDFIPTQK